MTVAPRHLYNEYGIAQGPLPRPAGWGKRKRPPYRDLEVRPGNAFTHPLPRSAFRIATFPIAAFEVDGWLPTGPEIPRSEIIGRTAGSRHYLGPGRYYITEPSYVWNLKERGWQLPGRGEPAEHCGLSRGFTCTRCGHHWTAPQRCAERRCPDCWRLWAWRIADDGGLRLWTAFRVALRSARVIHAVVAFPLTARITPENIDTYRAAAEKALYDWGAIGGCVVLHPWRAGDPEQLPDDRRVDSRDKYHVHGPHFHAVVLVPADFDPPNLDLGRWREKNPGIFIKHVPNMKDRYSGLCGPRDIRRVLFYQLGHAGVVEDQQTIVWFGCMNRRLWKDSDPDLGGAVRKVAELTAPVPLACPMCGCEILQLADGSYLAHGEWGPPD